MLCVYLILVFLFLHHVCFVKQSLDVYTVLEDSSQWAEIKSLCLTSEKLASNNRYGMLCINKKRQFTFSQQGEEGESSEGRVGKR